MPEVAALEFSPQVRAKMTAAIEDIAAALIAPPPPADGDPLLEVALYGGNPGFALFFAYLDRVAPKAKWRRAGHKHLDRAVARVPEASGRPFFSYGFPGTAWAVQHLSGWFIDASDDVLEAVDEALITIVEEAQTVTYDLQYGLVGYGLYALERQSAPLAKRLLESVVKRLADTALPGRVGTTWRSVAAEWIESPLRRELVQGLYWPDVMNGVAGICGLLAGAIRAGVATKTARRLLDGALTWVWSKRGMYREQRFSASLANGGLGIAAVAYHAARTTGSDAWAERWLGDARRIARSHMRVHELSLEHGVAGVAHGMHRLYLATGETVFADATHTYLERLLRRRTPGRGLAGFPGFLHAWERDYMKIGTPVGWVDLPGFLSGIAGIGLVLCSLLYAQSPAWDRALLLS